MNLKQTIKPSEMNLGGLQTIKFQQMKHFLAVSHIKPVVNLKNKNYQKYYQNIHKNNAINYKRKFNQKYVQHNYQNEVNQCFKRIANVTRSDLDCKTPHSYKRKDYITNRLSQFKDVGQQEHQFNVKSLLSKITQIEEKSIKNQKKIANCTIRARSNQSLNNSRGFTNSVRIQSGQPRNRIFSYNLNENQTKVRDRIYTLQESDQEIFRQRRESRNRNSENYQNGVMKTDVSSQSILIKDPKMQKCLRLQLDMQLLDNYNYKQKVYQEAKKKLLKHMLNYSIIKETKIQKLRKDFIDVNPELNHIDIEKIFQNIQDYFVK